LLFSNNAPPEFRSLFGLPIVDAAFSSSATLYQCSLPGWKLYWSEAVSNTGGYAIKAKTDESKEIESMLDDFDQSYLLSYAADFQPQEIKSGQRILIKGHVLKIKMKTAGLKIRSRSGFNEPLGLSQSQPRVSAKNFFRNTISTSPLLAGNMRVNAESIPLYNSRKESIIHTVLHFRGDDLRFDYEPEDGYRMAKLKITGQVYLDGRIINNYSGDAILRAPVQGFGESLKGGFVTSFDLPVSGPGLYELRTIVISPGVGRLGNVNMLVEVPNFASPNLVASGIDTFNKSKTSMPGIGEPQTTRLIRRSDPFACSLFVYNARRDQSDGKAQIESQLRLYRDDKLIKASEVVPVSNSMSSEADNGIPIGFEINPTPELTAGNYLLEVFIVDRMASQKKGTAAQTVAIELID
jgi:hypothetical protein